MREAKWEGSSYSELYCGCGICLPTEVEHFRHSHLKGVMHAGCSFSGVVVQITMVWWRVQKPLQAVTPQNYNLQLLQLNRIVKENTKSQTKGVRQRSLLPVISGLI